MASVCGSCVIAQRHRRNAARGQTDKREHVRRHRSGVGTVAEPSAPSRLTFSPLFVARVCFCLSFEPSRPHLFPSLPSQLPRHVLSFEVLTSERCIIQESRAARARGRIHTRVYGRRARPCLCGLAVCCRLLAERDKLSGSRFTEWVRILVDDCYFSVARLYLSAVLMSVRGERVIEALWWRSSFSL